MNSQKKYLYKTLLDSLNYFLMSVKGTYPHKKNRHESIRIVRIKKI